MTTSKLDWLGEIHRAVQATETHPLLIDARDQGLSGISGLKTVGLLQRLAAACEDRDGCYLEIGVFQGLTLVSSALAAPNQQCFGIDNFRILDPGGVNKGIVEQRLETFGVQNASLINMDFEAALASFPDLSGNQPVAVYFVDGPHDYRSQLVCLLAAKPLLADEAVIVVDDANYPAVRQASYDFLNSHPEYALLFEAYTAAHPANLSPEALAAANDGWLNGVHVIVRDPDGRIERKLPPVPEDRTLYFNDWLVHRLALAELAPEALALAQSAVNDRDTSEALAALKTAYEPLQERLSQLYPDRNTHSHDLVSGRLAPMKHGA